MLSCGPWAAEKKEILCGRLWNSPNEDFHPDEFRVQARTSGDEVRKVAAVVARKLNASKGPVRFFIPTLGWSSLSTKGADLFDPEADAAFCPALRERLRSDIQVSELATNLNSPEFAEALVTALDRMIKESSGSQR